MNGNYEKTGLLYLYTKRIFGSDYNITSRLNKLIGIFEDTINRGTEPGVAGERFIQKMEQWGYSDRVVIEYRRLITRWADQFDVKLFLAALYLVRIKEKSIEEGRELETGAEENDLDPLSLSYDLKTVLPVYEERTSCVMKALENLSEARKGRGPRSTFGDLAGSDGSRGIQSEVIGDVESEGVDLAAVVSQITFESIQQSNTSTSGSEFEDRIVNKLVSVEGVSNINTFEHEEVGTVEHDILFEYRDTVIGISAKRTLRERYKQYVNLLEGKADIYLTVTIGLDLTESKAHRIVDQGVHIFISPEVYEKESWAEEMDRVYSSDGLDGETLDAIIERERSREGEV